MSNGDGRESTLDRAIDHAVREMMHVDPRPGLRQRALHRLNDRPRRGRWIGFGAVATAALLVLMFATTLDREFDLPPASPGQAAAQPSATPGAIPPGPRTAGAQPETAPAPPADTAKSAQPAPESIFGPRNQQVRAASTPSEGAVGGAADSREAAARTASLTLTVTITDQREGVATAPKTVSMVVTDRRWGRVRSTQLNVDAQPEILADGRIRVNLTMEYRAAREAGDKDPLPTLTKTLSAILDEGSELTVSESADPAAKRTVKVGVKATRLK